MPYNRSRRARRNRRQRLNQILIVALLIILFGIVGMAVHLIQKYTPTKERMDSSAYYGITNEEEIPLIFGTEILETTGRLADGEIYVPLEAVNSYLNKRFYWDANENILIYTTPTEKMIITPQSDTYMAGEEKRKALQALPSARIPPLSFRLLFPYCPSAPCNTSIKPATES